LSLSEMDEISLWLMRVGVVIRSETPPHPDPYINTVAD